MTHLILRRREGQTLVMTREGETLAIVEIVRIDNENVRLGIHAPKDVRILRGELQSATEATKQ